VKITTIEAIPIAVPRHHFRSALGLQTTLDYGVVIVHTDEGIEGLGEISTLWDGKGALQCHIVDTVFAPALLGEDPLAINRCLKQMDTLTLGAWGARAAVEMALFDITGKVLDTPVYTLLGGRTRASVTLSRSIAMAAPAEMAAAAARYVEEGFTCVKVRLGATQMRT
jgi:L-alanine-DL-glutamate epimerase-like enolase superfamily enzyme